MKVLHVVGARPNFMKAAPVLEALRRRDCAQVLVHSGQHYDVQMSQVFFRELGLPEPDVNLEVGSGSHAQQTARVMERFETVVQEQKPDWVLVYGDINSTVAAALVAVKLGVRVAHVEAGLRSFDRRMPEEINRLITDQIANLLLTPSEDADANLRREGIPAERIRLVGNVMIDSLVRWLPRAVRPRGTDFPQRYALVTLHRPSNVDDLRGLDELMQTLGRISQQLPVVFPIHPRTRGRMEHLPTFRPRLYPQMHLVEPLGYLPFLALQRDAVCVLTDSGGIQEETTFLGVPCLTLRENTERPITVTVGTNLLVGSDLVRLEHEVQQILRGQRKQGAVPALWDGRASERIADALAEFRVES